MDSTVVRVKAQLASWSLKIDDLAARTQIAGARARFDDLVYVDELKVLHAIAQSKFDAFRAAQGVERAGLRTEVDGACDELAAAFKGAESFRRAEKARRAGRIAESAGPGSDTKQEP